MKLDERDIDQLSDDIKAFNAGAVDKPLGTHIDMCIANIKAKSFRRRLFWRIREYGLFWRFRGRK